MLCKKLTYDEQMEDYGIDDRMMWQWITEVIEMWTELKCLRIQLVAIFYFKYDERLHLITIFLFVI